MNQHHPYVSEVHEGKPAFEWCVLGVVIVALVVAFLGYTMAATVIIAVTAIVTATAHHHAREEPEESGQSCSTPLSASVWGWDCFCCISHRHCSGFVDGTWGAALTAASTAMSCASASASVASSMGASAGVFGLRFDAISAMIMTSATIAAARVGASQKDPQLLQRLR